MVSKLILRIISFLGWKLSKVDKQIISISDDLTNPLYNLLNATDSSEFIFQIVPDKIRCFGGRRLEINPFLDVLKEIELHDTFNSTQFTEIMSRSIRDCINASEVLGVDSDYFGNLPVETAVFPWDNVNPLTRIENRRVTLRNELKGLLPSDTALDQNPEQRKFAEYLRLKEIFYSIKKYGYKSETANFVPIEGQLLVNSDNNWVVLIRHGEHRVAVLYHLGFLEIPILIRKNNVIRSGDVEFWRQVKDNSIGAHSSLNVFDNIMKGDINSPLVNVYGYFN